MNFRNFVIIFTWKRAWSFILTNLNSIYPGDALCQIWLKLFQWHEIMNKTMFRNIYLLTGFEGNMRFVRPENYTLSP